MFVPKYSNLHKQCIYSLECLQSAKPKNLIHQSMYTKMGREQSTSSSPIGVTRGDSDSNAIAIEQPESVSIQWINRIGIRGIWCARIAQPSGDRVAHEVIGTSVSKGAGSVDGRMKAHLCAKGTLTVRLWFFNRPIPVQALKKKYWTNPNCKIPLNKHTHTECDYIHASLDVVVPMVKHEWPRPLRWASSLCSWASTVKGHCVRHRRINWVVTEVEMMMMLPLTELTFSLSEFCAHI